MKKYSDKYLTLQGLIVYRNMLFDQALTACDAARDAAPEYDADTFDTADFLSDEYDSVCALLDELDPPGMTDAGFRVQYTLHDGTTKHAMHDNLYDAGAFANTIIRRDAIEVTVYIQSTGEYLIHYDCADNKPKTRRKAPPIE